jgi:hypothetical protein
MARENNSFPVPFSPVRRMGTPLAAARLAILSLSSMSWLRDASFERQSPGVVAKVESAVARSTCPNNSSLPTGLTR